MVVLEDFTKVSPGRDDSLAGRVDHCPRCGRPGIEDHQADGGPIIVHSQISEVLGDGMRVEPQDCCAVNRR